MQPADANRIDADALVATGLLAIATSYRAMSISSR